MITDEQHEQDVQDILSLDLEYRLTIAHRVTFAPCDECANYLAGRREVLIPAVLEQAKKEGVDPVDKFAQFARLLHAKHKEDVDG